MTYEYRCEICHELVSGAEDEVLECPAHLSAGVMSVYQQTTATFAQISDLRDEALAHGDLAMARICDLAIHGVIEPSAMSELPSADRSRLSALTRDEALAECDRVICAAREAS